MRSKTQVPRNTRVNNQRKAGEYGFGGGWEMARYEGRNQKRERNTEQVAREKEAQ